MVDQPGAGTSRSYKIPGHTRQRRTTKPYARPSEVKKKGLLDTVKDYLSPSWLFGYFKTNEPEPEESSEYEEDNDDEDSRLNDRRSSLHTITSKENPARLSSIDEDDSIVVAGKRMNAVTSSSGVIEKDSVTDKVRLHPGVFSENNNKGETWTHERMSERLSGAVDPEREDIPDVVDVSDDSATETNEPVHSVISYSPQHLKRKPLPSVLHSRTITSSLFQNRGTPTVHSQRNSLLFPMSSSKTTCSSSQSPTTVLSRTNMSTANLATSSGNWRGSQPVADVNSTPGFSVSTFVTPVPRSFTKKRTESPFYPGRVTYGGASAISGYSSVKRMRRNSPGSEICQPVRKQQIRAKPLPSAAHGRPTSQTAQRILEALESVSSPLKDVRRIPSPLTSPSASPLSFLPSKLRNKPPRPNIGPRVSSLQAKLLGGPPVEAISTPQIAKVTGIEAAEPPKPKTSSTPFQTSEKKSLMQPVDKSLFSGLKETVLKTSLPTEFTPKALPTSLSPVEKTAKSSGKMRSAPRGSTHYSSKNNAEDVQVVNPLPEIQYAVPLPMNTNKKLPSFSFGSTTNVDSNNPRHVSENNNNRTFEDRTIMDRIVAESSKNGFIFSTPKPKPPISSVKEVLSIADDEISFSFSQPVSVKAMDKQDIKADSSKDLSNNSTFTSKTPSFGFKTNANPSKSSKEDARSSDLTSDKTVATRSSLANMFGPAQGEWDCATCMVRNKAADKMCVACGTAGASMVLSQKNEKNSEDKVSNHENSTTSLAERFASTKGSWNCGTCMINNEGTALKSVACSAEKTETTKPASLDSGAQTGRSNDLKTRFAGPANTWECGVCMIRNNQELDKCAACSATRPGCTTTEIDLRAKFAAPTGSWECEACMIKNQPSAVKCVACQTCKPGSESTSGSVQPGFSFGSSTPGVSEHNSSTNTGGFTFGCGTVSTSNTPSSTFGKSNQESAKSGFTSGNGTATKENTKPKFTFGVSSAGESSTVSKFTFGAGGSANDSKGSGFTFGVNSADKKSTSVQGDGDDKDKSKDRSTAQKEDSDKDHKIEVSGPLNIAQAAAAGLLKVPGMSNTTLNIKQVSTSPSVLQQQPSKPSTAPANKTLPTSNGPTSFASGPKNQPDSSNVKPNSQAIPKTATDGAKIAPFNFGKSVLLSESSTAAASASPLTSLEKTNGNSSLNSGNVSASKPETQTFSFTAQSTAPADKNVAKPSFSFGAPTNVSKSTSGPVFKFGAAELLAGATKAPFNNIASVSTVPEKKNDLPGIFTLSEGSTAQNNAKVPVFNFGSMNGPSTKNGGNTGQSEATQSGNALFNFTAGQPSNTDTENQNSLGGEDMDADSTSNHGNGLPAFGAPGGFSFTAQTPANASGIFGVGSTGISGNSTGGFSFGNGGNAITQGFQFGTPNNTSNNNTQSEGFNFRASAAASGGGGTSPFVFAGVPISAANPPANQSAPLGGFNFSAPPANTPTPSFNFGQGPATGQPVMFNVGAAQNTPSSRVIKKAVRRSRR